MSRQDNLKNLIATHQRQLQKLKEQQAALGLHTPPYVLTEIEDRAAELEQLQLELQEVQERAAAPAQPIGSQVAAGSTARVDWGDAPDVSVFFGRAEELATLKLWPICSRFRTGAFFISLPDESGGARPGHVSKNQGHRGRSHSKCGYGRGV